MRIFPMWLILELFIIENLYGLTRGTISPSGYEIFENVPEREQIVIFVVQVLDLEDEPVTCGSPYNFTVLNSPVTGHCGKSIINPNW